LHALDNLKSGIGTILIKSLHLKDFLVM